MKLKTVCIIGLFFFVTSYALFAQGPEFIFSQKPIDFAHTFNLIGGVLLIAFNYVFPKNTITKVASVITILGVIGHIGLCAIDFVIWSYGEDIVAREAFQSHIGNSPFLYYTFIVIAPTLFFIGLSLHGWNFIKKHPIPSLITILGPIGIGYAYFGLQNLTYATLSCVVFALGLILLLFREKTNFNIL